MSYRSRPITCSRIRRGTTPRKLLRKSISPWELIHQKITDAFGVLIKGGDLLHMPDEGLALRGTFIIDPAGLLRAMDVNDNSIGRSAKEALRKLQAAQFVESNPGQVCPASWNPGDDTLEPGMDLVGKI